MVVAGCGAAASATAAPGTRTTDQQGAHFTRTNTSHMAGNYMIGSWEESSPQPLSGSYSVHVTSVACGGDGNDLSRLILLQTSQPSSGVFYHLAPSQPLQVLAGTYNIQLSAGAWSFSGGCTWDITLVPTSSSGFVGAPDAAQTASTLSPPPGTAAPHGSSIRIGSGGFYEMTLVAEIYAQALEGNGYAVDRTAIGMGGRAITAPALEGGQFDLEPEYIGSDLDFYEPGRRTADAATNAAELQRALSGTGIGITVLPYSPAADQPGDNVAPLVRNDLLTSLPDREGFERIINEISARLNGAGLAMLDKLVTVDKVAIAVVARNWLHGAAP